MEFTNTIQRGAAGETRRAALNSYRRVWKLNKLRCATSRENLTTVKTTQRHSTMNTNIFLPMTFVAFVGLMGVMKLRRKEHVKEDKLFRLQDIKLRVTGDILDEFQSDLAQTKQDMIKTQGLQKTMEEQVAVLQAKAEKAKGDVDDCQGSQKFATDQLAMAESNLNDIKATSTKEENDWKAEMEALRKQLAERSSLCGFLKEETESTRKVCGSIEQKAQEPKKEEAKAEDPK